MRDKWDIRNGNELNGTEIVWPHHQLSPTPPHKINASDVVTLHWLSFQDGGQKVSEQRTGRKCIDFFLC